MNYYTGNIIPDDNIVFVFGSNPLGINGNKETGRGGAAYFASSHGLCEWNEKMNNCISKCGKSYGLVTVKAPGKKRSLTEQELSDNIMKLYNYAMKHPEKYFCIAFRNWEEKSLNGYYGWELCTLFYTTAISNKIKIPDNIIFSEEWMRNKNVINDLFEIDNKILDFILNI